MAEVNQREQSQRVIEEGDNEKIAVESTAKGFRLKNLTVRREGDESWDELVERVGSIIDRLEERVGPLV